MEEQSKKSESTLVDFDYEKYAEVERKATHTDSAVSLAAGIASIFCTFIFSIGGIILGIVGIIFGRKGRKDPEKRGIATAGIVCSVIGLVLSAIAVIIGILVIGAAVFSNAWMYF